jgi:hypothetical protein
MLIQVANTRRKAFISYPSHYYSKINEIPESCPQLKEEKEYQAQISVLKTEIEEKQKVYQNKLGFLETQLQTAKDFEQSKRQSSQEFQILQRKHIEQLEKIKQQELDLDTRKNNSALETIQYQDQIKKLMETLDNTVPTQNNLEPKYQALKATYNDLKNSCGVLEKNSKTTAQELEILDSKYQKALIEAKKYDDLLLKFENEKSVCKNKLDILETQLEEIKMTRPKLEQVLSEDEQEVMETKQAELDFSERENIILKNRIDSFLEKEKDLLVQLENLKLYYESMQNEYTYKLEECSKKCVPIPETGPQLMLIENQLYRVQEEFTQYQTTCREKHGQYTEYFNKKTDEIQSLVDSFLVSKNNQITELKNEITKLQTTSETISTVSIVPIVPTVPTVPVTFIKRQVEIWDKIKLKYPNYKLLPLIKVFADNYETGYTTAKRDVIEYEYNKDSRLVPILVHDAEFLENTQTILMNMYEDLAGGVRIYVRIKPSNLEATTLVPSGNKIILKCGDETTFGPFFGIIPQEFSNADMYSGCPGTIIENSKILSHQLTDSDPGKCCILSDGAGFCRVAEQLADGYNIVLFGYGLSGSGKTYTLFGADGGLVQLTIANIQAKSVTVTKIYELALDQVEFTNYIVKGKIIPFTGENKFIKPVKIDKNTPDLFSDLVNNIDSERIRAKRIKATPNNPRSSRSHLFIQLEFTFASGIVGTLLVCDLGGREKPLDILDMFIDNPQQKDWQLTTFLLGTPQPWYSAHKFTVSDPALSWYTESDKVDYVSKLNSIATNQKELIQLIKESIFINETINQLEYFFKQLNGQQPPTETMLKKSMFGSSKEIKTYDPSKFLFSVPGTLQDKVEMYKILQHTIDKNNKTKYVMICNVRPEDKFCIATADTLKFADTLSSG